MVKIRKLIKILSVVMCLLFQISANAMASAGNTGTITVRIPSDNGENIENIKVTINKVADIVEGQYVLRSDYENTGVDINEIDGGESYKNAADIFLKAAKNKDGKIEKYTDKNGEATIKDLEEGVYIISVKESKEIGEFSTAIISIPQFDEITGSMEYNIICEPKRSVDTPKIETPPKTKAPPKTGDNSSIYVVGTLLLCSASTIILYTVLGKRHKALDNK